MGTKTHGSPTLTKEAVGDQGGPGPSGQWELMIYGQDRFYQAIPPDFLIPNPGITFISLLYLAQFFFFSLQQCPEASMA